MLGRRRHDDPQWRSMRAARLLSGIGADPTLAERWAATAPDVREAYLDWVIKPRRARGRRSRSDAVLVELSANEQLHFQPRTASWTDILGFLSQL